MRLSVIIIARNAEATVRRCLESVAWADEIVVAEHGSNDRTADICREREAIRPAWELLTKDYKRPLDRMRTTGYHEDDQGYEISMRANGIPTGWVPVCTTYPQRSGKDENGNLRPFERDPHAAFQALVARYGMLAAPAAAPIALRSLRQSSAESSVHGAWGRALDWIRPTAAG
jgi:glycosyltransferase involved in cell wall biosynthesis